MTQAPPAFLKPTPTDQFFNKLVGHLANWGIGPKYMVVLETAGRKSGKIYRTPVNLMEVDSVLYLVAPRGETQWVRNVRHANTVTLTRGNKRSQYKITELPPGEKASLLKAYLDRYTAAVQQYFPVKAGSPVGDFVALEAQYPVMRLEIREGIGSYL